MAQKERVELNGTEREQEKCKTEKWVTRETRRCDRARLHGDSNNRTTASATGIYRRG